MLLCLIVNNRLIVNNLNPYSIILKTIKSKLQVPIDTVIDHVSAILTWVISHKNPRLEEDSLLMILSLLKGCRLFRNHCRKYQNKNTKKVKIPLNNFLTDYQACSTLLKTVNEAASTE